MYDLKPLVENRDSFINSKVHTNVRASAGTGKTYSLIERYTALIDGKVEGRPVDPRRILFVTFTRKAVGELKKRLIERGSKLYSDPNSKAAKNFNLFEPVVFTYHGFALEILREHSLALGIPPDFRVASEQETAKLLHESSKAVLRRKIYYDGDERIENLLTLWHIGIFQEGIESLYEDFLTHGVVPSAIELPEQISSKCRGVIENFIERFANLDVGRIYTPHADVDSLAYARLLPLVEEESWKNDAECLLLPIKAFLHRLLLDLEEEFEQRKRNAGVLGFSDLERLALELLQDEKITNAIRSRFDYILVDEFQDTNQNQFAIIEHLSWRFKQDSRPVVSIVGDPKQCIYTFRGADLHNYMDMTQHYQLQTHVFRKNFRSNEKILDFVNAAWGNLYAAYYGEEENTRLYEPSVDALECGLCDGKDSIPAHAGVEAFLFETKNSRSGGLKAAEVVGAMAEKLILRIEHLRQRHGLDYKDFGVLVYTRKNLEVLRATFLRKGVPVLFDVDDDIASFDEFSHIEALLEFLADSSNLFALVTLLASPFVGLTDEELSWLVRTKEASQALLRYFSDSSDGNLQEIDFSMVSHEARRRIELLRDAIIKVSDSVGLVPVDRLLDEIIEATGYVDSISLFEDGALRVSRLRDLLLYVRDLSRASGHLIEFVLLRMRTSISGEDADTEAASGKLRPNAVSVMTIHQAKGLEFDVVFLLDTSDGSNTDANRNFLWHPSLGDDLSIKIKGPSDSKGTKYPEPKKKQEELEAERLRQLYVALTRPRNRLELFLRLPMGGKNSKPNEQNVVFPPGVALVHHARIEELADEGLCTIERVTIDTQRSMLGSDTNVLDRLRNLVEDSYKFSLPKLHSGSKAPGFDSTIRIAVRNLLKLTECKRMFFLLFARSSLMPIQDSRQLEPFRQRLRKAETPSNIHLGELLHLVMEHWNLPDLSALDKPLKDVVLDRFAEFGLSADLRNNKDVISLAEDLSYLLSESEFGKTFRASIASGNILREVPFEMQIVDGLILTGKIDAVISQSDGRMLVVDYKFGSYDSSSPNEEYAMQLATYKLALMKQFGLDASMIDAYLVFPSHRDQPMVDPFEPLGGFEDVISSLRRLAKDAVEMVAKGMLPDRIEQSLCRQNQCTFVSVCWPMSIEEARHSYIQDEGDDEDDQEE